MKSALAQPDRIRFQVDDWQKTVMLARKHGCEPFMPLAFNKDFLVVVWRKALRTGLRHSFAFFDAPEIKASELKKKSCLLSANVMEECKQGSVYIWTPAPGYELALISKEEFYLTVHNGEAVCSQ